MPLQLSLPITVEEGNVPLSLKPRFGLSVPFCSGLLCSSENLAIPILSAATTVFLVSTVPNKVKKKIRVLPLTKVRREHRTGDIQKASLAPEKSSTYLKIKTQECTVSSFKGKSGDFLT